MLTDLYLMENYFEEPFTVFYEDDLIRQYGADQIGAAIEDGLLERRPVPCAAGRVRCVCRLSEKGCVLAGAQMAAQTRQ
jgi:hypothetical protein